MTGDSRGGGLSRLIYTSFATVDFDAEGLTALLAQCRAANSRCDVTGLLLFRDQRFLQVLEGPAEYVSHLMAVIADDPRHFDVYVLSEEPITQRLFPSWAMGFSGDSGAVGAWPVRFVRSFERLTASAREDDALYAIGELLEWFSAHESARDALPV